MSTVQTDSFDAVIIGGGISGLSLAYYLQKQDAGALKVALLEKESRLGGKIRTERVGENALNVLLEQGPDSILTFKPAAVELARELELGDQIIEPSAQNFYILRDGQLRLYPAGMSSILPTKFLPFACSRLLSLSAKLRMAMEPFVPVRQADSDESVASFITRRLGSEALNYLAEPMLSGIYGADPFKQSMQATFPQLVALEKSHGGLLRGILGQPKKKMKGPAFVSLKNGMQSLSDAIVARLSCSLKLGVGLSTLRPQNKGYEIGLSSGETIKTKALIFTSMSDESFTHLASLSPGIAVLPNIRTVSSGFAYVVYRKSEINIADKTSGVLIPKQENRRINAITFSSNKYVGRSANEFCLLRVFFGGSRDQKIMNLSDTELISTVRLELQEILGISATPVFYQVERLHQAQPQYDVGHLQWAAAIKKACPPGVFLCGSSFYGSGLPDCIQQSKLSAAAVYEYLAAV